MYQPHQVPYYEGKVVGHTISGVPKVRLRGNVKKLVLCQPELPIFPSIPEGTLVYVDSDLTEERYHYVSRIISLSPNQPDIGLEAQIERVKRGREQRPFPRPEFWRVTGRNEHSPIHPLYTTLDDVMLLVDGREKGPTYTFIALGATRNDADRAEAAVYELGYSGRLLVQHSMERPDDEHISDLEPVARFHEVRGDFRLEVASQPRDGLPLVVTHFKDASLDIWNNPERLMEVAKLMGLDVDKDFSAAN